jgi:hypothetical protein
MGDKLREDMEGGKRDETFFSALLCAHNFTNCLLKQLEKIVGPLRNETLHHEGSRDK